MQLTAIVNAARAWKATKASGSARMVAVDRLVAHAQAQLNNLDTQVQPSLKKVAQQRGPNHVSSASNPMHQALTQERTSSGEPRLVETASSAVDRVEVRDKPGMFSDVVNSPLVGRDGTVLGVSYMIDLESRGAAQDWVTSAGRDRTALINTDVPSFQRANVRQQRAALVGVVPSPWVHEISAGDRTFFVDVHGTSTSASVGAMGGTHEVPISGTALASLVLQSDAFRQAGEITSITLLSCASGLELTPGGLAYDFQSALRRAEFRLSVHAPDRQGLRLLPLPHQDLAQGQVPKLDRLSGVVQRIPLLPTTQPDYRTAVIGWR